MRYTALDLLVGINTYAKNVLTLGSKGSLFLTWGAQYLLANWNTKKN